MINKGVGHCVKCQPGVSINVALAHSLHVDVTLLQCINFHSMLQMPYVRSRDTYIFKWYLCIPHAPIFVQRIGNVLNVLQIQTKN